MVSAPFLFIGGGSSVMGVLCAALLIFGLGRGFYDCNIMPLLCGIARPELRATGYGIFNLVGNAIGGATAVAAGVLKDSLGLGGAIRIGAVVWFLCGAVLLCIAPARRHFRLVTHTIFMQALTANSLQGVWAAAPTPFTADGSLDIPTLEENIRRYDRRGIPGVYTTDSDGEFYALELNDFQRLAHGFGRAMEQTRMHAAMGITWCSTAGMIDRAKAALDAGIPNCTLPFRFGCRSRLATCRASLTTWRPQCRSRAGFTTVRGALISFLTAGTTQPGAGSTPRS